MVLRSWVTAFRYEHFSAFYTDFSDPSTTLLEKTWLLVLLIVAVVLVVLAVFAILVLIVLHVSFVVLMIVWVLVV